MGVTQTNSVHLLLLWRKLRAFFGEWIQEPSLKRTCKFNNSHFYSSFETFGEWRSFRRKRFLEICDACSSLGRDSSEPCFENDVAGTEIVDSKKT